ncbi:hypothetical protein [Salipiger aestuarii]|uniref:hypothetical protein n=1 Tax=Salipiger aestuarii TaxID=568098 RepID=UPI00123A5A54|nr:hypothetical protein [Salipiger aestuarii]KAA8616258.1 hypothetical protein AL037_01510 [Salipiger aestuarii]
MINEQPASGTATGLPALMNHVQDMQDRAILLDGVLEAILFMENEDACENGRDSLMRIAKELSHEIFIALDKVNLPKLEGAE